MGSEPSIRYDLEGWSLYFALLELQCFDSQSLADLRRTTVAEVRMKVTLDRLAELPVVAALRKLFRAAGCDPTRYRPSSEALLRRVLKGHDLPAINPLVDLNNCLSLRRAVPCCVMAEGAVAPPYVLRRGEPGESYQSLKGPFNLEGKPLLVDRSGPCDAPITGSERVKIRSDTTRAWLVVYLPTTSEVAEPGAGLASLLAKAPVAKVIR